MRRSRAPVRIALCALIAGLFAAFVLPGCGGGGGTTVAGGGTAGTGVSVGAVSDFGSIILNGAEFFTTSVTPKSVDDVDESGVEDNVAFRIGMVVAVRHSADDNDALEVEFDGNVRGPVESATQGADNVVVVLGHPAIVDGTTRFEPPGTTFADLAVGNYIEISGFADEAGRIRASFIQVKAAAAPPGTQFRVLGFVSGLSPADNTFRLGPLPGMAHVTVDITQARATGDVPAGLANNQYVKVRTEQPSSPGAPLPVVAATRVETEEFPFAAADGTKVSFEGFPAGIAPAPPAGTFTLNGIPVSTAGAVYVDAAGAGRNGFEDLSVTGKIQADGTMSGGVLAATRITFK